MVGMLFTKSLCHFFLNNQYQNTPPVSFRQRPWGDSSLRQFYEQLQTKLHIRRRGTNTNWNDNISLIVKLLKYGISTKENQMNMLGTFFVFVFNTVTKEGRSLCYKHMELSVSLYMPKKQCSSNKHLPSLNRFFNYGEKDVLNLWWTKSCHRQKQLVLHLSVKTTIVFRDQKP